MELSMNIRSADNGFILRYDDPELVRKNKESEEWVDASVEVVFTDPAALMDKAKAVLARFAGGDVEVAEAYNAAFNEASTNE